ncbi:cytochrome P450 [Dentipellis sp. KUC8613]|nr:cytochrome P450 [Dentipellis sp. KUC8613]
MLDPVVFRGLTPILLLLFVYFVVRAFQKYGSRGAHYPPGPPTLPIIGNLLAFPRERPEIKFAEWARQYGDVISLKIFSQTIVVIQTPTLLKELFEKKGISNTYRPVSTIIGMLVPSGLNFAFCHETDDAWKAMRKASQSLLSKESLKRFEDLQHAEMTQTMVDLLRDPQEWYMHIHRFTFSLALGIIYGKRCPLFTSPDVRDFLDVNHRFMDMLNLGRAPPVDTFPILKYVPKRWAKWKRNVERIHNLQEGLYGRLVDDVRARVDSDMGNGAFMEDLVRNAEGMGMRDNRYLSYFGGTLLEGADIASPTLHSIVLLAISFPEKQHLVAEEINRVIGSRRVPRLEDLENLPYTRAFVSECFRFMPVSPLGVPHEMVRDEVINGILYPEGAVVFQNTWHMFHDERYFERPYDFLPERFLEHPHGVKPGVIDDPARRDNLLFGGGRRVCPGLNLARTNLDLLPAYMFWAFEFSSPLDRATGKPKPVDLTRIKDGLALAPLPFECDIVPRAKERTDVLQQEFARAAEFLRPLELEITEEDRKYNATYRDM